MLLLIGLLVVSCSATSNLPQEGLPTAVPPNAVSGQWAIPFEYEFPLGFWAEGLHRYGFLFSCPAIDVGTSGSEWRIFEVTGESPVQDDPVYMRLQGLSFGRISSAHFDIIHPEQKTVALVTFLGLSEETAQEAAGSSDCEVLMRWDDVATQMLAPGNPYQP
jgi:hypothetical protein